MEVQLGDFKSEGTTLEELERSGELKLAEEGKENKTPPSSPDENKQKTDATGADQNKKQEENVPFHKHPRWKAMREANEQLAQTIQELQTKLSGYDEKLLALSKSQSPMPQWFITLYGENQEAWKQYQEADKARIEAIKADITREIQSKQGQSQTDDKKYEKWVDAQIDALEDEGLKFDRNELMKIALDYAPTDSSGNISFRKAYDLMEKLKANPAKSDAKKKIAASTTSEPKSEGEPKTYKTTAELRRKGWSF